MAARCVRWEALVGVAAEALSGLVGRLALREDDGSAVARVCGFGIDNDDNGGCDKEAEGEDCYFGNCHGRKIYFVKNSLFAKKGIRKKLLNFWWDRPKISNK